jgi:hypothetical protein
MHRSTPLHRFDICNYRACCARLTAGRARASGRAVKFASTIKDRKDYYSRDDHENAAWGRCLVEKHRKEHEFAMAPEEGTSGILELAPQPS